MFAGTCRICFPGVAISNLFDQITGIVISAFCLSTKDFEQIFKITQNFEPCLSLCRFSHWPVDCAFTEPEKPRWNGSIFSHRLPFTLKTAYLLMNWKQVLRLNYLSNERRLANLTGLNLCSAISLLIRDFISWFRISWSITSCTVGSSAIISSENWGVMRAWVNRNVSPPQLNAHF